MLKISLGKKAAQFSQLARDSVMQRPTGVARQLVMAAPGELGVTFIGHSTFFLQMAGLNVLLDPNYAQWLVLLKRLRRPGVRLRDLPRIDLVLVTHAHMDHLHKPTLRRIALQMQKEGFPTPLLVVPKNVRDLVVDLGFREVVEAATWQELKLRDGRSRLAVVQVPSRHWGARMLKDFHRGYGGYVLRADTQSIYHAGDTAYFDGFREIGERLEPQIALMPIGAYSPESYRNVHTSPEDALRGFVEMGARWMVPMHYGTFRLSREPMEEPLERLEREARRLGVNERVLVLEEGSTALFEETEREVRPRAIS